MSNSESFGKYLKSTREHKGYSLRDVEREIKVSNAYLSQLEKGKIKQPSPNVLYKLSQLYQISYAEVLRLVGYPIPDETTLDSSASRLAARTGPITQDEEEALVDYLEFLRSRKQRRGIGR